MYQILAADRYREPFRVQGESESLEEARKLAEKFAGDHLFVCHERDIHITRDGKFLEYAGPSADTIENYYYRLRNT